MIPKKIHYCWFGNNPKTDSINECIESWKKYLPDYEIIEWNESNFDINKNDFVKEAYTSKKYAFVSDFARLQIIYDNGGIYFDVDIKLIKNLNEILEKGPYLGCENNNYINTGLGFAAEPKNEIVKKMLDEYNGKYFIINGEMDLTPCTHKNTDALVKLGWDKKNEKTVINGTYIYPTEYFCPYNYYTGEMNITENTYSIHECQCSWLKEYEKKLMEDKKKLVAKFGKKLGRILYIIEKFFTLIIKEPKVLLDKIKSIFRK